MFRTLSSFEKYKTNIDDVGLKRRNPEPKKWSLFDTVRIFSSGVKMTLKEWFTPMETSQTLPQSLWANKTAKPKMVYLATSMVVEWVKASTMFKYSCTKHPRFESHFAFWSLWARVIHKLQNKIWPEIYPLPSLCNT